MADKATDKAKEKADEKGIDLSSVEGSGSGGRVIVQDVEQAEEKFLVGANPALRTNRHFAGGRVFYRDPARHPDGPEAQKVTKEEFAELQAEYRGLPALVKIKGGEA